MASDNFDRADGGLGANWTTAGNTNPAIASNAAVGGAVEWSSAYYSAAAFDAVQSSEIIKGNAFDYAACGVRMAAGGDNRGIFVAYFNNGTLYRSASGMIGSIGSPATYTAGDTAKIAVSGNVFTMSKNGTTDPGGTVTNADTSGGAPGIAFYGTTGNAASWVGTGDGAATGWGPLLGLANNRLVAA